MVSLPESLSPHLRRHDPATRAGAERTHDPMPPSGARLRAVQAQGALQVAALAKASTCVPSHRSERSRGISGAKR